jgi:hypothetical protein
MLAITLSLSALAIYAVARVTLHVLDRFGLEPWAVLLWLGLAEWPSEEPAPRPRRTGASVTDQPTRRRRSPHRRLARTGTGRRPAAPRPAP